MAEKFKKCPICKSSGTYERTLNNINLIKCDNCSFVYANLSKNKIIKNNNLYDDKADQDYKCTQGIADELWFERIARSFTKKIGKGRVLDVGCGNGMLLKQFIKYGWEAHGIDISPWSKKYAIKYGFKIHQELIENAKLPLDYFDLIISTSTLEHIPNPVEHVKEILRILKPKGLAYFCGIPNYGNLTVKIGLSKFYHNTPPGHVNYFTKKSISALFNNSRFHELKDVRIWTYGIPELYKMYNSIITNKNQSLNNHTINITNTKIRMDIKHYLYKLFIFINYHFGRIFCLGDKLEVLIKKC